MKLKPCPFCGGPAEVYFTDYIGDSLVNQYQIICSASFGKELTCLVMPETTYCKTEQEAIEAWNRRSNETNI